MSILVLSSVLSLSHAKKVPGLIYIRRRKEQQYFEEKEEQSEAQKEAEEKAAKNKARAERVEALQDIIDAIEDFVEDFYPDMYDAEMFESFDVKELDKVVAEAYDEVKRMAPLFDSLKDLEKHLKMGDNVTKTVAIKKTKSTDQAIADFLRKSGL